MFLKTVFLLFSLLCIISAKKAKKSSDPDYYDKPKPKELPQAYDLRRCEKFQKDCLEYEFFTLSVYLEPQTSQKAKKAKFNRWIRHNKGFKQFYLDNYTDYNQTFSQVRLFSSEEQGRVELILNESQYFHENSFGLNHFKDTYLIYMHFEHPKLNFKSKINKLVQALLYHTAYSTDSKFEEWIHFLPEIEKKDLILTLKSEEIELLKDERETYKLITEKRKEYINDFYDFVGLVKDFWMNYHPQMVKDFFRRPNVTMSDYFWAR